MRASGCRTGSVPGNGRNVNVRRVPWYLILRFGSAGRPVARQIIIINRMSSPSSPEQPSWAAQFCAGPDASTTFYGAVSTCSLHLVDSSQVGASGAETQGATSSAPSAEDTFTKVPLNEPGSAAPADVSPITQAVMPAQPEEHPSGLPPPPSGRLEIPPGAYVYTGPALAPNVLGTAEWLEDSEAPNCMRCGQEFNLVARRHHCRQCGQIFCHRCCNSRALLQGARAPTAITLRPPVQPAADG